MHATEIQWYIIVFYDKLSVQQCLCIYIATELNLKGGFSRNPRNPSRSATAQLSIITGHYTITLQFKLFHSTTNEEQ